MNSTKLILGTVQFGLDYGINNKGGRPSKETVFEILHLAFDSGIRQLDSAAAYGDAELIIGEFQEKTGKRFLVNTKFHIHTQNTIPEQLDHTLQQLAVESIHTYFYHRFDDLQKEPASLNVLKGLKAKGKIQEIGISIYTNEEFEDSINHPDIDVIQFPFNLLDNTSKRGVLMSMAKEKGKELQIRSAFLQGLFFKELSSFPEALQPLNKYLVYIHQLAEKYRVSIDDLALGYALSNEYLDGVIIGVDSKGQLVSNLSIQKKPLPEPLIKLVDNIRVQEEHLLYPYNWK